MRIMHMEDLYYQETYRGYQLNEGGTHFRPFKY